MPELLENLREIFKQVQHGKRCHPQYLAKMKKYYEQEDDGKVFAEAFITCLAEPLSCAERHPNIENTLGFATKFAVSVYSCTNREERDPDEERAGAGELCPFWSEIFDFILSNHRVADVAIRFRLCYFLNMLLNSMGLDAYVDDAVCDRIRDTMIERLLDTVPKIRAQAILAIQRLQDPRDENCPIIKVYIFHMSKDPQAEVRRAVLHVLARNRQTLAAALKRTRDVNEGVRKLAYEFLSKVTVRSLKIEQREQLLKDGLRDRSEKVSTYVKLHLLPKWLENYDDEFIKLLRALDAEKALDISIFALQVLFKATVLRKIVEQVPVDRDTKLIPLDKLTGESVIYWRCAVRHLYSEGCPEEVENVLPDLSKFCTYMRKLIEFTREGTREHWEVTTLKFILLQLFEITKSYDLSDEVGRENLKELILDILKSDENSQELIDFIVKRLDRIVPDTETRLNLLADVISEIRMPQFETRTVPMSEAEKRERDMKRAKFKVQLMQVQEEQYEAIKNKDFMEADSLNKKIQIIKGVIEALNTETAVEETEEEIALKDDEETLVKCLQIMYSMMQGLKTLNPILRSLFEDMVVPYLDHSSERLIILAIKITAVCGVFDVNLAKNRLRLFFIQFGTENNNIWLVSLKGLFDLMVYHGLERLGMSENENSKDSDANQSRRHKSVRLYSDSNDENMSPRPQQRSVDDSKKNIIDILISSLDNVDQDLRTIAVEGLTKLLLHRRISSEHLLSRLIILWHNPVTIDDVYISQCLSHFFEQFPVAVPNGQQMMESSFLPTLRILAKAPATSPLSDINPVKVAQLILYIIGIGNQKHPLGYEPQNHLALAIIAEALNEDSVIDPGVLIRILKYLTISLEDEATIKLLQAAIEKLLSKVDTDKRSVTAVMYFKRSLYGENPGELEEEEGDEDENENENENENEEEELMDDEPMIDDDSE